MGEAVRGVEDQSARFVRDDLSGTGRFRRFGEHGPLYEVTATDGETTQIRVVLSGEVADYPLASALSDPLG